MNSGMQDSNVKYSAMSYAMPFNLAEMLQWLHGNSLTQNFCIVPVFRAVLRSSQLTESSLSKLTSDGSLMSSVVSTIL